MFNKIIFILLWIVFLLPHFVWANVVINEIMYDLKTGSDESREWIEIYNDSNTSIDSSSFKFFEADTNHKLTIFQGDTNIRAQSYAIIVSNPVKFKIDWPNFSGTIFDSSFSLSNSGETLAIKDGDLVVDKYSYRSSSGGAGNGKSLQKINGLWQEATPTLGTENKISYIPPPPLVSPQNESTTKKVSTEQIKNLTEDEILVPDEVEIPVADFTPDILTGIEPEESSYLYLFVIILVIFLSVGGGVVYLVRRKENAPKIGEDFEISEE